MQSVDDSCKLSQLGITSATKGAALILITPPEEQQKGKGAPGHDHGALRQRERPQVRFSPGSACVAADRRFMLCTQMSVMLCTQMSASRLAGDDSSDSTMMVQMVQ